MKTALIILIIIIVLFVYLLVFALCEAAAKEQPEQQHKFNHIKPKSYIIKDRKVIVIYGYGCYLGKIYEVKEDAKLIWPTLITDAEADEIYYIQNNFLKTFEEYEIQR